MASFRDKIYQDRIEPVYASDFDREDRRIMKLIRQHGLGRALAILELAAAYRKNRNEHPR